MMVSTAIVLGLALSAQQARAQDAPSAGQSDSEVQAAAQPEPGVIIVTGTSLRGVAPVGSDITTISSEDLLQTDVAGVTEIIQDLPQVFDLGVSDASRGQSGGSGNAVYATSINLRGIGPYATLTLLDGHRAVNNSRSVDPSIVPSIALERIEVVPDGASAIYGSDAIAGVANLILRRRDEGLRFASRYGFGDDYHEYTIGGSGAVDWGSGGFVLSAERVFRDTVNGADRDFFVSDQRPYGGNDYRINQCDPGNIAVDGVSYAIPAGGVTPANSGMLTPNTENVCDYLETQDLLPRQQIDSVSLTLDQDLTDGIAFFGDAIWSKRKFRRQPGEVTADLTVPDTNPYFVAPPGTDPDSVRVRYSFENTLPPDPDIGSSEFLQLTGGLRVDLPYEWQTTGYVSYGKSTDTVESRRGLNNAALDAALQSSDPDTAFNPFGGPNSQAVIDALSDQVFLVDTDSEQIYYKLQFEGPLFEMPGGEVRLAVGYEGQELSNRPGLARGGPDTPYNYRYFDRRIDSFYGEANLPVFGPGNARPGFEELELNAALRYDKYSDTGSTTNPKFGIRYVPVDGVTLRGSYGTSFRAPLFADLYGNSSALYVQPRTDPTAGGSITRGVALSGGNTDLGPETATTWSAGVDFEPVSLPGFRASATFFSVDYKNQIAIFLSDQAVLTREDDLAGSGVILRGDEADARVQELLDQGLTFARGVLPDPLPFFIDGRPQNLGQSITEGIDLSLNYRLDTDNAGLFRFSLNGTYLTKYKVAIAPAAPLLDLRNTIFNPLTFKGRFATNWEKGPITAGLTVNYVNGYSNTLVNPAESISDWATVDLRLGFSLADLTGNDGFLANTQLAVDVRNLFDADPPYANVAPDINSSGAYDATASSPIGRVVGLSLRTEI